MGLDAVSLQASCGPLLWSPFNGAEEFRDEPENYLRSDYDFDPESPITAMACGLRDGVAAAADNANRYTPVPRYWENSQAYIAGYRAGRTGNPAVMTPLRSRSNSAHPNFAATYVDGETFDISSDEASLDRDPTVVSWRRIGR
jgi:hypothetical protein